MVTTVQYIFRTEEALEPDTSGRKINSGCNLTLLVKYLLSDELIIVNTAIYQSLEFRPMTDS